VSDGKALGLILSLALQSVSVLATETQVVNWEEIGTFTSPAAEKNPAPAEKSLLAKIDYPQLPIGQNPAAGVGGNQGEAVLVDNNADVETDAESPYSNALNELRNAIEADQIPDVSNQINESPGRLSDLLTENAHESDSLILQASNRTGVVTKFYNSNSGGVSKFAFDAFANEKRNKDKLGFKRDAGGLLGMLFSVSPFGVQSDTLKISAGYLHGAGKSNPAMETDSGVRSRRQPELDEPLSSEDSHIYDRQSKNDVWSLAAESYLLDGRLYMRGESAQSSYNSDITDSQRKTTLDEAQTMIVDLSLMEKVLGSRKFYWGVSVEHQDMGPWFRSPGNSAGLAASKSQNFYTDILLGGLYLTLSTGVETENVSKSEVRPAGKDRWNELTAGYRFQSAQSEKWYGKPSLSYTLTDATFSEVNKPVSYTEDLLDERGLSHDLSARFSYPWGVVRVGYMQETVQDNTGLYDSLESDRTSISASYRALQSFTLRGNLGLNQETNVSTRDDSRSWQTSLGMDWSGKKTKFAFNLGMNEYNAYTGLSDRNDEYSNARVSWQVNPDLNLWFKGNHRNSNTDSNYEILFGMELAARNSTTN
jgi:hypothetical protein